MTQTVLYDFNELLKAKDELVGKEFVIQYYSKRQSIYIDYAEAYYAGVIICIESHPRTKELLVIKFFNSTGDILHFIMTNNESFVVKLK